MDHALDSVLKQLPDRSLPALGINLTPLSDLPRAALDNFRAAWAQCSPARRLELVSVWVERAEEDVQLDFRTLLREMLADEQAEVRRLAVEGLWEDERTSLIPPLAGLLSGDPSADVRAVAAMSLGRFVLMGALGDIGDRHAERAENALRAAWTRPDEPVAVRRRILEGLAGSEQPDLRGLISDAYRHADPLMRQSAIYAMGRSSDTRWAKAILAELTNAEAPMRYEAATAAGELGLEAAVKPLIRLLGDADSHVSEAAAMSLGHIGGKEAQRALEGLLRAGSVGLRAAAADALAEMSFTNDSLSSALLLGNVPGQADDKDGLDEEELFAGLDDEDDSDDEDSEDEDDDDLDDEELLAELGDEDDTDDDLEDEDEEPWQETADWAGGDDDDDEDAEDDDDDYDDL